MTSRLATRLIGLERETGSHADMIWKYSDLSEVKFALTPISDVLVAELIMFLDGEPARHFVSILPTIHSVRVALSEKNSAQFRHGAALNPFVDDSLLNSIAAEGGKAADIAQQRLDLRARYAQALNSANVSDIPVLYEELASGNDAAALAASLLDHEQHVLPLLGSDRRYDLRAMVMSELGSVDRDRISAFLVGVLDDSFAAPHVDETLALWLLDGDTTRAGASRDQLQGDRASLMMLMSRLTDSALRRVLNSETLGTAARQALGRRIRNGNAGGGNSLDLSMLSSLRMAGLGVSEISSLIFSSHVPLETDQLVKQLDGLDSVRLASFLSGTCLRSPQPGETGALLAARDLNEQEEIAQALGSDINDLPWFDELLVGIPRKFIPSDDHRSVRVMNDFLSAELGSDAKSWEVVLAMSTEWEGSLRSLTSAARQL